MIVSVENRIKEVSRVTEANSAAAEESAAVSNELSDQARTLNRLLSQFHISSFWQDNVIPLLKTH